MSVETFVTWSPGSIPAFAAGLSFSTDCTRSGVYLIRICHPSPFGLRLSWTGTSRRWIRSFTRLSTTIGTGALSSVPCEWASPAAFTESGSVDEKASLPSMLRIASPGWSTPFAGDPSRTSSTTGLSANSRPML